MLDALAMAWVAAERAHGNPLLPWQHTDDERREEIKAHCLNVLDGKILQRDMGIGDLAIYHGRHRLRGDDADQPTGWGPPQVRAQRGGVTIYEIVEVSWENMYDTIDLAEATQYVNFFVGAHCGNNKMTNLQLAGHVPRHMTWATRYWYVALEGFDPGLETLIDRLLFRSTAALEIGNRRREGLPLRDLWLEPRRHKDFIRPQENFAVSVVFDSEALRELKAAAWPGAGLRLPLMRMHIEGWVRREIQ
jgi:hypothetical protein